MASTASRILTALQSWQYILRERYLQTFREPARPAPLSWKLDPAELKECVVHWPASRMGVNLEHWLSPIMNGLRRHVPVEVTSMDQPEMPITTFHLVRAGKAYPFSIDTWDFMDRISTAAIDQSLAYFKMQYRAGGYDSARVVPGGYVNLSEHYCRYLRWLRSVQVRQQPQYDVYGRFSLAFARETRERVLGMLHAQQHFRFEGSWQTVRYTRSLEEAALSKVCIDLPGNGDFCFRLIDYLGIGACVVAARHRTVLHVPLEDRKHLVYAKEDLSDFVELCRYYLEHDDERNQIVQNSREFFDRYLHPDQLGAYYLFTALEKIDSA